LCIQGKWKREALEDVTGYSGVLTEPMRRFLGGRRMALGNPGEEGVLQMIRSFADLAEKDLALTLAHAREYGLELPGTGLCLRMMYEVYGVSAGREGVHDE
jgi:hypothetical protein